MNLNMNEISNRERKSRSEKVQANLNHNKPNQISRQKIRFDRKKIFQHKNKSIPNFASQINAQNAINQILVKRCSCGEGFIINMQADPVKLIEELKHEIYQMKQTYEK
jgi:hypothetical protein